MGNTVAVGNFDTRYVLRTEMLSRTATKTANYTAVAGELVQFDLSGASANVTMTLPASPTAGQQVGVTLLIGHATYNLVIALNSSAFRGGTDDIRYFDLCLAGDLLVLEYVDSTTGWVPVLDRIRPHEAQLHRTTSATPAVALTVNGGVVDLQFDSIDKQVGLTALTSTPWTITTRRKGNYELHAVAVATSVEDQSRAAVYVHGLATLRALAEQQASYGAATVLVLTGVATLWDTAAGTALKMQMQIVRNVASGSPTLSSGTRFTLKETRV